MLDNAADGAGSLGHGLKDSFESLWGDSSASRGKMEKDQHETHRKYERTMKNPSNPSNPTMSGMWEQGRIPMTEVVSFPVMWQTIWWHFHMVNMIWWAWGRWIP